MTAHHHGLAHDLRRMLGARLDRRRMLRLLAGATALPMLACTDADLASDGPDAGDGVDGATGGTCATIPEETAGPYPGDGSNGPNVLTLSGVVRSDIRTSVGGASGTAVGVPLTVTLTLVDSASGCGPLVGHAIYLWHCDRAGNYSMYSAATASENYLRGVQVTDAAGQVTFTTVFPGCYAGRWPHIHFEMYPSLARATSSAAKLATSQLALPQASCQAVYATSGYEASVGNLAALSLATDNVFADGVTRQLASVTGSATAGYAAHLTVGIGG